MKFSARELRLLRQSRNMQQKDVAYKMKISPQRYSILENNDGRSLNKTQEILQALNLTERSAREFLNILLQMEQGQTR